VPRALAPEDEARRARWVGRDFAPPWGPPCPPWLVSRPMSAGSPMPFGPQGRPDQGARPRGRGGALPGARRGAKHSRPIRPPLCGGRRLTPCHVQEHSRARVLSRPAGRHRLERKCATRLCAQSHTPAGRAQPRAPAPSGLTRRGGPRPFGSLLRRHGQILGCGASLTTPVPIILGRRPSTEPRRSAARNNAFATCATPSVCSYYIYYYIFSVSSPERRRAHAAGRGDVCGIHPVRGDAQELGPRVRGAVRHRVWWEERGRVRQRGALSGARVLCRPCRHLLGQGGVRRGVARACDSRAGPLRANCSSVAGS
jgi:hypothetical protein